MSCRRHRQQCWTVIQEKKKEEEEREDSVEREKGRSGRGRYGRERGGREEDEEEEEDQEEKEDEHEKGPGNMKKHLKTDRPLRWNGDEKERRMKKNIYTTTLPLPLCVR